jgi:hypothetical protein
MELRFWTDPETGLPHTFDHGITEEEVRQVLRHPVANVREDRNTRAIMGQTQAGRCLKVIFVPDEGGEGGFVVTAFELKGKGLKAYRRNKRRRQS